MSDDPDPCGMGGSHRWERFSYVNFSGKQVSARRCAKCKIEEDL